MDELSDEYEFRLQLVKECQDADLKKVYEKRCQAILRQMRKLWADLLLGMLQRFTSPRKFRLAKVRKHTPTEIKTDAFEIVRLRLAIPHEQDQEKHDSWVNRLKYLESGYGEEEKRALDEAIKWWERQAGL